MKSTQIKNKVFKLIIRGTVYGAGTITLGLLCGLILYIIIKGVPYLSPQLFSPIYTSENVSMLPAIFNTLWMVLLALVVSVPLGIGSAIYLVEYAKKGNKVVELVRITSETLVGIPSVIYGLFGMLFFVSWCTDISDHGITCYYEDYRRSTFMCTRCLKRR